MDDIIPILQAAGANPIYKDKVHVVNQIANVIKVLIN